MTKEIFEKRFKDEASNSRNLVSGIVNSKTSGREKYKYLSFVAYELIQPVLKPSEQYKYMKDELNVEIALYETTNDITNEYLSEKLVSWRESYKYEIDGIVVYNDKIYPRPINKNPEYAFAFKMVLSEQVIEAKVLDVLWTPSKHGLLKPRIRIEPVVIGGAKIEFATAFNGAYVRDNKIGIGSLIQLIRSGDVIPHILNVITPAQEAKMPDVEYSWNETGVDIVLKDIKENSIVREKNIVDFFKKIDVVGFSSGNVKRVIKAGYDNVEKILSMSFEDFLSIDGFKEKMSNKIHSSIQKQIKEIKLSSLMEATNLFGRGLGKKRFDIILKKYPNILQSQESETEKINKINNLSGFANKTAKLFVDNIPLFMDFLKNTNLEYKLDEKQKAESKKEEPKSHPLYGKNIAMSGFRDKELQEKIEEKGGNNSSSISKNTFILLVKDKEEETGKITKAKQLNITIMTPYEFKEKYEL
jgi:NAD-dependent DNA ligase